MLLNCIETKKVILDLFHLSLGLDVNEGRLLQYNNTGSQKWCVVDLIFLVLFMYSFFVLYTISGTNCQDE